jgi:excisionase family DNA binding protein
MKQAPQGTVSMAEVIAYISANQDRHLSLQEATEYLSLSERTLRQLLPGIPHFRVGKKILFRRSLLDRWMDQHREHSRKIDIDRMTGETYKELFGAEA